MKNITYSTLLFSLFLFSCENMQTVIDLDVPQKESVLVLNGLLDTDTNARVVISHSVGAFSTGRPSFINNAKVALYKNGIFEDSLLPDLSNLISVNYYDDGNSGSLPMYYYTSPYEPERNTNYTIEVDHNGYDAISAETFIPDDILLYDIEIDTASHENKIELTFRFDDNPNVQNFYRLKVITSCRKTWEDDSWRVRGAAVMMSNDQSFPSDIPFEGYTFIGNSVVFDDGLFNGQQKTITLDVDPEVKWGKCDTVIINFSTFSDDTYSYYSSLGDHRDKGELNIFGGEVIPVYTNVENGLGILISINAQDIYLKP